jgi:hypothetical protein
MGTLGSSKQIEINGFTTKIERTNDEFIIDSKMCSNKFNKPSNQKNKSINSDLRRKKDDPQMEEKG